MRPVPSKYPQTLGYRQKARFDPNYIHRGNDYGCPVGTPVQATAGGVVHWAGDARKSSAGSYGPAYGIQVIIRVGSTYCLYAHLSSEGVTKGQTVKMGQVIGKSGATGNVTGAHLHYQECTQAPPAYKSDRKPQFIDDAPAKPTFTAADKQGYWIVNTTTLHGRDFPHVDHGAVLNSVTKGKHITTTKQTKLDGKHWNYREAVGAWYAQEYLKRTHAEDHALKKNYRVLSETQLSDVPGGSAVLRALEPDDVFLSVGWEMYNNQLWLVNAEYEWASAANMIPTSEDIPQEPVPVPVPAPAPTPPPAPKPPTWPAAPAHWYPLADRKTQNFDGKYSNSLMSTNCVILHSTEGTGWPGYNGGGSAPHMTIMPDFKNKKVIVRQHLPGNRSARALENRSGGVETNTANVFQIELVGTCDPPTHKKWGTTPHIYMPEAPQWFIDGVADVMRWVDKQYPKFQIRDGAPRGWSAYPASYGTSKYRMSPTEWGKFYGIAGHQHVPENSHGDPGNFPIKKLIDSATGKTTPAPAPAPAPEPVPEPGPSPTDKFNTANYGPGKSGPHITWLGERLVLHGFGKHYTEGPGPTWGEADRLNVQDFQVAQKWTGAGANGLPGSLTLALLSLDPVVVVTPPPLPEPEPEPEPTPTPVPAPAGPKPAKYPVTVFNINAKYMVGYSRRVSKLANIIKSTGAHVVLTCESGTYSDGSALNRALGWGGRRFGDKSTPKGKGSYVLHGGAVPVTTAIHANLDRKRIVEEGQFTTAGSINKWATWALLEDTPTGVLTLFVVTHAEYRPKGANTIRKYDTTREAQLNKVFATAKKIASDAAKRHKVAHIPIVVGGDMNGDLNDPYDGPGKAAARYGFTDSDRSAKKRINGDKGTHAKNGGLKKGYRIDRFFTFGNIVIEEQETFDGYPHTDHNALKIYITALNEPL